MKMCTVLEIRKSDVTDGRIKDAKIREVSFVDDDHEFGWKNDDTELHYEGKLIDGGTRIDAVPPGYPRSPGEA